MAKEILGVSKTLAVVKADAYGHGMKEIVSALRYRADCFGVHNVDEGVSLRTIEGRTPVLVFAGNCESIERAIAERLTLTVSDRDFAVKVIDSAKNLGRVAEVHIAVNSGMNRFGFDDYYKFKSVVDLLKSEEVVNVTGIYSHFHTDDISIMLSQRKIFDRYVGYVKTLYPNAVSHISATSGIKNFKATYDMSRLGIGLYGVGLSNLDPAMRITSSIALIREVHKGEYVGYSCQYRAERDIIVAVVYGGYADGILRTMTGGDVVIRQKRAKIIGSIAMDVFFVDVTDIGDVTVGESVTIVGDSVTFEEVAKHAGTIPYEIMTSFHGRVTREYER